MDPGRLVSLGISPTTVRDRIQGANLDMPWDKIENDQMGATLRLYGRVRDVEDLGALPVARMSAGRVVRLNEIAKVRRDLEREKARVALSWAGSEFKRSIDISVIKVPGVDTIRTIDRIKAVLEEEARSPRLPHGIEYRIRDGETSEIIVKFIDRERGKESLLNIKDLTWYSHVKAVIEEWAQQFVQAVNAEEGEIIKDSTSVELKAW